MINIKRSKQKPSTFSLSPEEQWLLMNTTKVYKAIKLAALSLQPT